MQITISRPIAGVTVASILITGLVSALVTGIASINYYEANQAMFSLEVRHRKVSDRGQQPLVQMTLHYIDKAKIREEEAIKHLRFSIIFLAISIKCIQILLIAYIEFRKDPPPDVLDIMIELENIWRNDGSSEMELLISKEAFMFDIFIATISLELEDFWSF